MADKIRCGVIGAGGIGLKHLQSLAECPDGAAVALAESNAARAKIAGDKFLIARQYADYRELLEQPDIHAVVIALPNYLHAPIAVEALEAGKHVLVEKPMATSYGEALRVAETARRVGRTLMVAQHLRFHRHAQAAAELIRRGALGEVYHAAGFWLRRAGIPRIGSWFTQKKFSGGGCLYDLGPHLIDLTLSLVGDFRVAHVSGQIQSRFGPRRLGEFQWGKSEIDPNRPCDVEDFAAAWLRLKNGQTVTLEIAWAGHFERREREMGIDLLGDEGGLGLFPAKWFRKGASGYETIELTPPAAPLPENNLHHFVNCILVQKPPLITLDESLRVQQTLDAIYQSAALGQSVALEPEPAPEAPECRPRGELSPLPAQPNRIHP